MSMFEEFILWFAEINFICNFIIILSMITFIDMFFKLFSCKKKYNVKFSELLLVQKKDVMVIIRIINRFTTKRRNNVKRNT